MSDGWDQVLVVESLLDGEWYPWEFAKQRRENWTVYDDNPHFRFRRFVPEDASRASEAAAQARIRELTAALDILKPMAEQWAEGGGSHGPEMRDFEEACALIEAAASGSQEGQGDG